MKLRLAGAMALPLATLAPAAFCQSNEHQHEHQHHSADASPTPLTAPGSDAFATIQEAVQKLRADPNTDWSRVNLEALRQHLVDMNNFTFNVEVIEQTPIDGGLQFTVKPTTSGASASLDRLFSAHPAILKQEFGWDMSAEKVKDGAYITRVSSSKSEDAVKIRGLGYIGIVALGKHHQEHHWQMATGGDLHKH